MQEDYISPCSFCNDDNSRDGDGDGDSEIEYILRTRSPGIDGLTWLPPAISVSLLVDVRIELYSMLAETNTGLAIMIGLPYCIKLGT